MRSSPKNSSRSGFNITFASGQLTLRLLSLLLLSFGARSVSLYALPDTNDIQIARIVRQAVRDADADLLHTPLGSGWRDYLKLAAINLDLPLQPLMLIKYDEDASFRHQLKQLIDWQRDWKTRETKHFIYYYRWDQPPPEMILEIQDVHFEELASLFTIDAQEKIPYRYDPETGETVVYNFGDLRGGIVSPDPFDLEKAAVAAFSLLNPDLPFLVSALSRIYGSYFQNPGTSQAYYEMCLEEINAHGYISAAELFQLPRMETENLQAWHSAYAFTYKVCREFGCARVSEFLLATNMYMGRDAFVATFERVFGQRLSEFEGALEFRKSAGKL